MSPLVQSILFALAATLGSVGPVEARQQPTCPAAANALVDRGYQDYGADRLEAARDAFAEAQRLCPGHLGARVALANVELRAGRTAEARAAFDAILASDSTVIDALVGRGIVAWREGELQEVFRRFTRVTRLDPGNATAADYLGRVPAGIGPAPERPPFVRPGALDLPARVSGERFQVRDGSGWRDFYVKGMNLGAALPGRHPSEFPDAPTYRSWIEQMAGMGVNTIRLYTIHPPHFYQAVLDHNRANPAEPLWLVHGVWAEPPPGDDFLNTAWQKEFFDEMERVVDLLHGRADLPPRPGHASGHYTADVSPWTLAYVIGREWEPFSVVGHNRQHRGDTVHAGRFLTTRGTTPTDAWMARACEHMIAYEMDKYHAQRPMAYTSWPTLDPLRHETESTVAEELAIRARTGERVVRRPKEYDNDAVALDATLVRATEAFQGGWFASFHAYPYYPELMIREAAFQRAASSLGPSNYFGYLTALERHHDGMPVLIAEYGVPASLGIAHLQPQGWHHGGHTEAGMAEVDARLTREIAEAGMAGGIVFAWIDEWFKKNWVTIDFQVPAERKRLWLNRLDAEQQYGVFATDPEPAVGGASLAGRLTAWRQAAPLYGDATGSLRAAADAAYLWLLFEPAEEWTELYVGFDVLRPEAGETRWPGAVGPALPVGVEFALHADRAAQSVRMVAHPSYVAYRTEELARGLPGVPLPLAPLADVPAGLVQGRFEMNLNRPYQPVRSDDGGYVADLIVTNRRRFSRDRTEFAAVAYDRGVLRRGEPPDGVWELSGRALEVRIPWGMLNVSDPSQRRVLSETVADTASTVLGTALVPGIRVVASVRSAPTSGSTTGWSLWPTSGDVSDVALFTWPTWEEARWRMRQRPVYDVLRETWRSLSPRVLQSSGGPR